MGDWAQSIVDVDVTGDEAAELGERLTVWLIDTGVIASELTDCALGSPVGHPQARTTPTQSEPTTSRRTRGPTVS